MKSIDEISHEMETIRLNLTQADTEKLIATLQGQHAALDWVITEEEEETKKETDE